MDGFLTQLQSANLSAKLNCVLLQDGLTGRCVRVEVVGFTFYSHGGLVWKQKYVKHELTLHVLDTRLCNVALTP